MGPRFRWLPLCAALLVVAAGGVRAAELEPLPDPTTEPRPAEIMPLAGEALTLGVDRAGSDYFIVGERGHILRSRDGGEWEQLPSPTRAKLNRIRFRDDREGWIVGNDGVVLQTTDGGATWQLRNFSAGQHPLYDIHFLDDRNVIAVGAKGQILRSGDGGMNWTLYEDELSDFMFHFFTITELRDGTVLVVGEKGMLAVVSDSGATWTKLQSPYVGSWFGALPYGPEGAVIFGLRGHVFVAPNLGVVPPEDMETFDEFDMESVEDPEELVALGYRAVDSGTDQGLFAGALLNSGEVLLVGVNGTAIRSHGGVQHFSPVRDTVEFSLNDLYVVGKRALAVGLNGPAWISSY